jgi:hypothetical protein
MVSDHQELEDAIAALLLSAGSSDDRPRLLAHLRACSSCRELATRLARITSVLPLEPDPVQPPARLHDRVLAAVAAAPGAQPSPPVRRRPLVHMPRRAGLRPSLPSLRFGVAVAATLVFALGAGAGAGAVHGWPFGWGGQAGSQSVARHQLQGTGTMAGVQATAITLRADGLTLVDFKGMPPVPPGQVYELWLITPDGRALPAAVFEPDPGGSKVVLLTQDLRGTKKLAVTIEQGPDGAPVPTQQPQLSGTIA